MKQVNEISIISLIKIKKLAVSEIRVTPGFEEKMPLFVSHVATQNIEIDILEKILEIENGNPR